MLHKVTTQNDFKELSLIFYEKKSEKYVWDIANFVPWKYKANASDRKSFPRHNVYFFHHNVYQN